MILAARRHRASVEINSLQLSCFPDSWKSTVTCWKRGDLLRPSRFLTHRSGPVSTQWFIAVLGMNLGIHRSRVENYSRQMKYIFQGCGVSTRWYLCKLWSENKATTAHLRPLGNLPLYQVLSLTDKLESLSSVTLLFFSMKMKKPKFHCVPSHLTRKWQSWNSDLNTFIPCSLYCPPLLSTSYPSILEVASGIGTDIIVFNQKKMSPN